MNQNANATLKLLIVDDIPVMRQEFIAICREYVPQARIDEASNVMEAMESLINEDPPYDAVFTDVNMPAVSGLKLISLVRNLLTYRTVPVIVMSTLTGRSDIARALQLGANAYLTRPMQREYFEIVYLGYLDPVLRKKR